MGSAKSKPTADSGVGATKVCATCGRSFAWRRRWQHCWDAVRHCSRRCSGDRPGKLDAQLEQAIVELLAARAGGATICPSEAARLVAPEQWRALMPAVTAAARRLAARGVLVVCQGGRVVDPSAVRGPIRLRRLR
jgi:hypothetical protein